MKAIMYHYVRPFDPKYPNFNNLHIEDFRNQLDFFEQEYGFADKDEFHNSFKTGKPLDGVVLTFDDGLYCHYDFLYKELKKRKLWGIFYVPTQPYTQGKLLDVHRTHLLLGKFNAMDIFHYLDKLIDESLFDKTKLDEFKKFTYKTQDNHPYTLLIKRILNYFISYEYREGLMDKLMAHFIPNEADILKSFYLSVSQIKEMHNAGMIIGSHTVNHPVMSRLSDEKQESQIIDSFAYLEGIVNAFEPKTFCYPYGGFHSFTDQTEALLTKHNCLYSFNVEQRDIESSDLLNRPQALPRYDCNQFKFGQVRKVK